MSLSSPLLPSSLLWPSPSPSGRSTRRSYAYRDAALKNGRARLQRDDAHRDEIGQINRRAAHKIADQNATIEELMAQIRLLEMINRNYKKQLERRQS